MSESASPSLLWRSLAAIVAALPWSWLGAPAALLAWLVGSVLRIRRQHALQSVRRAGLCEPGAVVRDAYRSLARVVFETLWVAGRPKADLRALVELDCAVEPLLRECSSSGRGLVVASAHAGNWDLLACAIASSRPVTVITRHMSWRSADRFWQATRARRGVAAAEGRGVVRAASKALSRGEIVAFMIDQAPQRAHAAVSVPFLGQQAWVDPAFSLMAARCQAPIALVIGERLEGGRHRLHVPMVLRPPERASRAWAREAAIAVTQGLEGYLRAQPRQWLWLHRRWKSAGSQSRSAETLEP